MMKTNIFELFKQNEKEQMIYVHIPFCNKKCYYCNFVSYQNQTLIKKYFSALNKEIISRKTSKEVTSIFIGGGTPSSVPASFIKNFLNTIYKHYKLSKNCEITIELNPQSTTKKKLEIYKKSGINRLSYGVQSLDEKKLAILGREQKTKQVFKVIALAKEVGFDNISADLLLGLENQTKQEIVKDAQALIDVGIEHFSAYMLILEPGTKLDYLVQKKQVILPSDDESVEIYNHLLAFLKTQDFQRYEVSNFAKNNKLGYHNLGYWQMKEYLGFGVGAHSFSNLIRQANSKNLKYYLENKDIEIEDIDETEFKEEAIMLGLRTKYGINKALVENNPNLNFLLNEKFVEIKEKNIAVSEDKFGVLNSIILKLVE